MSKLNKLLKNVHFFTGYLFGFTTMWIIPRSWYNEVAIFYYDLTEP